MENMYPIKGVSIYMLYMAVQTIHVYVWGYHAFVYVYIQAQTMYGVENTLPYMYVGLTSCVEFDHTKLLD